MSTNPQKDLTEANKEFKQIKNVIDTVQIEIQNCKNEIQQLKNTINQLDEALANEQDPHKEKKLRFRLQGRRTDLLAAQQNLTSLETELSNATIRHQTIVSMKNKLVPVAAKFQFETSFVLEATTTGFEKACRRDLQLCLWSLFNIKFWDKNNFFKCPRKFLISKQGAEREFNFKVFGNIKRHYGDFSGEIDILLYIDPKGITLKETPEGYVHRLWPIMQSKSESPNWNLAILSFEKQDVYTPQLTPDSSRYTVDQEVTNKNDDNNNILTRSSHSSSSSISSLIEEPMEVFTEKLEEIRNNSTMYIIFEASLSKSNIREKFKQLRNQLAFIVIRYHMMQAKKKNEECILPTEITEFEEFVSMEALKLVAFAGVTLPLKITDGVMTCAMNLLKDDNERFGVLKKLQEHGRLLILEGHTHDDRISHVEQSSRSSQNE